MSGLNITDCTPSFGSKNVAKKTCSTWNDVLRAHDLPTRKDGDGSISSPRPLGFPIAEELRLAGHDVECLRHLPEFRHWQNPYFGMDAFVYDLDLLKTDSAMYIPLVDLFVRGPVGRTWYDKLPIAQHKERQDELRKLIFVKKRKIRQVKLSMETLDADIELHEQELERCIRRIHRCFEI